MHARPQSFDKPIKTKKSESNSKNSQNKKLDNPANNQKEDDAVSVAPSINLISFEPATDPNQLSSNQNQSNNPFEQIVNGNAAAQPVATNNNINNDLAGIDLLGGVSVTTTGANNTAYTYTIILTGLLSKKSFAEQVDFLYTTKKLVTKVKIQLNNSVKNPV